jgi:outer membrane protein assembly factor BamB
MILLVPFILAAGCGEKFILPKSILIHKLDPSGNVSWVTTFENGMGVSARSILEMSDGGYLIYGSESNVPQNEPGHQSYPLLIRLDSQGTITWSRTLNQTLVPPAMYGLAASSAVVTQTGDILISTNRPDNYFILTGPDGTITWVRPAPVSINSAIPTCDGGGLFVGMGVIKADRNGAIRWETPLKGSKKALQTSDGRYILDHHALSGTPPQMVTDRRSISCLDTNGTIIWSYAIEGKYTNDVTSLHETPGGLVEATLVSGQQLTFNRDGEVIAEKNITAASTLSRTSDGEYIYWLCSPRETVGTLPPVSADCSKPDAVFHVVREAPNGTLVWDHAFEKEFLHGYPSTILQTRDGGFILL